MYALCSKQRFLALFLFLFGMFSIGAPSAKAISGGYDSLALGGQVQFWVQGVYNCTGTLIDARWVLTAKHCITNAGAVGATPGNTTIYLGDLRLGQGETRTATALYINQSYDVGLVELRQPTTHIELIRPYGTLPLLDGSLVTVQGWGATLPGGGQPPSPVLQTSTHNAQGAASGLISLSSVRGTIQNGDSGASVSFLGLTCGIISSSASFLGTATATSSGAVAAWIAQTSSVGPGGLCLPPNTKKRVRVMIMADQILTGVRAGSKGVFSFLPNTLADTTLQTSFVGSHSVGPVGSIEGGNGNYQINDAQNDAKCDVFNYAPDIVMLSVGFYDIAVNNAVDAAPSRVDSLISTIEHVSPQSTVLVASLLPVADPTRQSQIDSFNAVVKNLVVRRRTAGEHVDYIDLGSLTLDDSGSSSSPAPSENGYVKWSDAFALQIEGTVNNGWIADSLPLHSDLCSNPVGGGGGGSGGSGGGGITTRSVPAETFTVNAGGTNFTVSQPSDSVATYTWTDGGTPTEWLTSADGSELYNQLATGPVVSGPGSSASATITVNAGSSYQTVDGFGGAMTDSAAYLIGGSPQRDTIMNILFGTGSGGAGLTMVRSPMGSSDLMADPNDYHTYEDTPGSFSATAYASDNRQINLLQQAKSIAGGNFKLLGTPWTAPGWMKRGGLLRPAACGTQDDELDIKHVGDYAAYFASYVNTYSSVGLTPWMVSMGNEPENCKTTTPTTLLSANDEVALAHALKATLPSGVKVLGWDHNWNDEDYVHTLTSQGGVDAIGYHCYDGTHYGNQTESAPTYMTECSGFTSESGNVAANLGFEVANLLIGPLRNGSRGSLYWTLAQDPNGNPHLGGTESCQNCRGMITVNADGSFQPSQDYYFWAQFSKFIPPGSVRIDSNNAGDLSTVAFRNGNSTTLVVLNSNTHADGGSAGSDERNLQGHIVQYSGDTTAQKTAWLVGADGYRRWIDSGSTFNCLKYDAGMQGPDTEPGGALDKYINLQYVWAVCGATVMGTDSELEIGTYLKSTGGARLTLTKVGLTSVDSSGNARWAPPPQYNGPGSPESTGDRLILQEDQNLVLYSGLMPIWSSNTKGSGAIWLAIRDDATFALFNKANQKVWESQIDARSYRGKIVEWDGDTAAQKTSWLVGNDGNRRYINDLATFQCLHDAGAGNALDVSSDVLNSLPNFNNVWATCGGSQIGTDGALEQGSHLQSGNATLTLTSSDLIVAVSGKQVWHSGHGGAELKLQTDGNLVEYDTNGRATWATNTNYSDTPADSSFLLLLYNTGSLFLFDTGSDGKNIFAVDVENPPLF